MIKQTFGIPKIPFLQSELNLLPHQQEVAEYIHIHSQHGGLSVLTGEPGVGKTIIKESLERQALKKDQLTISFSRTMDTYSKIIMQMVESLGIELKHLKAEQDILIYVHEQARKNKTIITMIDEAHLLGIDSLRKLRLFFDKFPKRSNLLLLGQPDLMIRLSMKNNHDIRSRITYSKELKPLTDDDLMKFIEIETENAKLPNGCYEDGALELILRSVRGNLRLCANLCYTSLLEACKQGDRIVDHTHVNTILIQPHWKNHDDLIHGDRK